LTETELGVAVALAVPAALRDVEIAGLVGGVVKKTPAHRDTPDSTVTEAHANLLFACCGRAARFDRPGRADEPVPAEAVGPRRLAPDTCRLSVLDEVE
jgi:hypothetical protein